MNGNILRGAPDSSVEPDLRGIGPLIFEKMKENGDKIAQIDAETGKTQSYKELHLRSIRVAQHFQAKGYNEKDNITLCLPNVWDSCLPFLASVYLGINISSLDITLPQEDCEHLLKLVKPRVIFCIDTSVKLIESALENIGLESEMVVLGETTIHTPFSEFLVSSGREDMFEVKPVKDVFQAAVMFFSSGTTGFPKGIYCTHYGLLLGQAIMRNGHDLSVMLYFTSLYWISSVLCVLASIIAGTARIICSKFEVVPTLKLIEKYKVSFSFMSPYIVQKVVQSDKMKDYDMSSLRTLLVGGSCISEDYLKKLRVCFPYTDIWYGYGMTENAGCCVFFNPQKHRDIMNSKITSVGMPLPGYSYKIIDVDTEEPLGPNKLGEICMKGKGLMCGYHNNPLEFSKVWDEDGFLHTGDVGYYDEDHCFYVVDRIKEVLKYQAWHVPPAELESILLTHPAVEQAAVFGKPHPEDGEHPTAAVVLRPGMNVPKTDILNFVNEQVPDRKQLRGGLVFLESLPYTPTGKLKRRQLRDSVIMK